MTLEQRVLILENQVKGINNTVMRNKMYVDADIAGLRQQVCAITPFRGTKTAYIGDTEIIFERTPGGNITVYMDGDYSLERIGDKIRLTFEPLEKVTDITISIL